MITHKSKNKNHGKSIFKEDRIIKGHEIGNAFREHLNLKYIPYFHIPSPYNFKENVNIIMKVSHLR